MDVLYADYAGAFIGDIQDVLYTDFAELLNRLQATFSKRVSHNSH